MKIELSCQNDFYKLKDGQFVILWGKEIRNDVMLPCNLDRVVAKVISKKDHKFLRFPKELDGNSYNDESFIVKIIKLFAVYENPLNKSEYFKEIPQNYRLTNIIIINKKLVKEAIKRKKSSLQNEIAFAQQKLDRFLVDLTENFLP